MDAETISLLDSIKSKTPESKRRHIYKTLRHEVLARRMAPGSFLPSASDLAAKFGVSYVTMHSALSDLVRDGLLVRQKGKGTFVADIEELKKRPVTSHMVMLLPPRDSTERSGTTEEVMQNMHGAADGAGVIGADLSIISLPRTTLDPADLHAPLRQVERYDGALFIGDQYAPLINVLVERNFPVVIVGDSASTIFSVTAYDRMDSVELGVNHLCGHGYRRLGYLGHLPSDKYEWFCRMLVERGLEVNPAWMQTCANPLEGQKAADAFLQRFPLPEAVFVENHRVAGALVALARQRGVRVPEDLAVMAHGANTHVTAEWDMSLVAVPYEEMGQQGATLLDRLIRGTVLPPVREFARARLVIRSSCGCRKKFSDSAIQ